MTGPGAVCWRGLALAVSRDRALVGPEAAALLVGLLAGAERIARRDGIALSPQLRELREVLRLVAASAEGHADVPETVDLTASVSERIDTKEAAVLLDLTPRHVRRLAASGMFGPVRRAGRGYLVDRAEVEALRLNRAIDDRQEAS